MNRKLDSKIAPFLIKLYDIVSDETNKSVVSWNQQGDSFVIVNLSRFCQEILPLYFKHSNFASFVRQLNMYDFHKTKHSHIEHEYDHAFFKKGSVHLLSSIKRKSNSEAINNIKPPTVRQKKMEVSEIKTEARNIWKAVNVLKERVEVLEGKHSFLEFCHSDLAAWNQKIKQQLSTLFEKEKNLENMLLFAIKNFAPNFFIKGNDLKFLENILPSESGKETQFLEKSSFQKNDVLNKIFKEIKSLIQCYYLVNNNQDCSSGGNGDHEVKSSFLFGKERSLFNNIKSSLNIKEQTSDDSGGIQEAILSAAKNSVDVNSEVNFFNQLIDIQNKIFNNIEEQTKGHTLLMPKKSGSVRIIENSDDFDPKPSHFLEDYRTVKVIHPGEGTRNMSLLNKRNRPAEDFDDLRSHSSFFKLERKIE